MSETAAPGPAAEAPAWVRWPAAVLAVAGGALLVFASVLTVVSVTGRALIGLGLGPVPGDFELVQMSVGIAVFASLPWCQLRRGHVTVDILVDLGPAGLRRATQAVGDALLGLATAILLWRLWAGLGDKMRYGETTFILGLPIWWFYVPAVLCMAVALVVTVWTVWDDLRARGR